MARGEDVHWHAGVQGFHTVPVETLGSQIDCVLTDIGADVVKTGMLPCAEVGMHTVQQDVMAAGSLSPGLLTSPPASAKHEM